MEQLCRSLQEEKDTLKLSRLIRQLQELLDSGRPEIVERRKALEGKSTPSKPTKFRLGFLNSIELLKRAYPIPERQVGELAKSSPLSIPLSRNVALASALINVTGR
jgi:hypothetical protein